MPARRKLKKTVKRKKPPAATEVQEPLTMPTIDEADPKRAKIDKDEKQDRRPKSLRKGPPEPQAAPEPEQSPRPVMDAEANRATAKAMANMALVAVGMFAGTQPTAEEIESEMQAMDAVLTRYGDQIPHIELIALSLITLLNTLSMFQRGKGEKLARRSNDLGSGTVRGGEDGAPQADDRTVT